MTHLTGPRQHVVLRLARAIGAAIDVCEDKHKITITECTEALHEVQMRLVKIALRPWEDETCPTCPQAMKKRGDQILRQRRKRHS